MIIDAFTEFADDFDAGAAGVSNEIVNMGNVISLDDVRNVARGNPLYVIFTISEAFADTSAGAGYIFHLVSDSSDTPLLDGTATIHGRTHDFNATELPVGTIFQMVFNTGPTMEAFLGVQLENDAADVTTAGKVNAWLSLTPVGDPVNQHFPDASN